MGVKKLKQTNQKTSLKHATFAKEMKLHEYD